MTREQVIEAVGDPCETLSDVELLHVQNAQTAWDIHMTRTVRLLSKEIASDAPAKPTQP